MFKEFSLHRHKDRRRSLPDQLNFAFAEGDSIIMKDGARLVMFACHGPDLNSASVEELDAQRALANRALLRLDEGFAWQVDCTRYPSAPRPVRIMADPVSAMIDHEAALHYAEEGRHFESQTIITIAWRAPSPRQGRVGRAFISGQRGKQTSRDREREWFEQQMEEFIAAMKPVWKLTRLDVDAMLSHLTTCINGRVAKVKAPRGIVPLDSVLGNQDFITGFTPKIGGRHIRVISLAGFPAFSHAELVTFLGELPFTYRYSLRAIPLPIRGAMNQISVQRRNWIQKKKAARALFSETIGSGNSSAYENEHAIDMANDANAALKAAENGDVRFCYATPKIVIIADTAAEANERARQIFQITQNLGFDPRHETINCVESWLGSIPIHGWYDVRKPLVNTRNLADIMPLTTVWPGLAINPNPYYPADTPALCYGATTGGTPFRFNLHISDVGHTLLVGPTSTGKSVALGTIAANARAIPRVQIFFMDKGYSAYVLTKALGGAHLNLAEDDVPLQPLAHIDDPIDRMKIQSLLEDWLVLNNVRLLPGQSKALHRGLALLAEQPVHARSLTTLMAQVQDETVRAGLSPYEQGGRLGHLLDADNDVTLDNDFITFELETLMGMGPQVTIPVLTYLFHRIEQRLDGRPTLIIIDEAWIALANATFGMKLEEWLRTFRKKNAAVVLATQSLSEIANSAYRDILLESCPTKIYLPNASAKSPQTRELYHKFGLSDRQIDIIGEAAPKRDYYYESPLGQRLFQFALGPAALAFIAAGTKNDMFEARRLMAEHGEHWRAAWLRQLGLAEWANYLEQSMQPASLGAHAKEIQLNGGGHHAHA